MFAIMGMSGGEVIIILAVLFVTIVVPAAAVAGIVLLLVKRSSTPATPATPAVASAPPSAATLVPGSVQVQGRPLKCLVCGHDNFRTSASAPGRADVAYTCAQCGYLHWFVPT